MHARWTWLAGSVRERETHARSDNSFSENDTSITRRGAAITISPSANPPKADMDIAKPKGNPPDLCGFMESIHYYVMLSHSPDTVEWAGIRRIDTGDAMFDKMGVRCTQHASDS